MQHSSALGTGTNRVNDPARNNLAVSSKALPVMIRDRSRAVFNRRPFIKARASIRARFIGV